MNEGRFRGRLTRDPELKKINGKDLCEFTLACKRRFSNKTNYIKCSAWNIIGKNIFDKVGKANRIYVSGDLILDPKEGGGTYVTLNVSDYYIIDYKEPLSASSTNGDFNKKESSDQKKIDDGDFDTASIPSGFDDSFSFGNSFGSSNF